MTQDQVIEFFYRARMAEQMMFTRHADRKNLADMFRKEYTRSRLFRKLARNVHVLTTGAPPPATAEQYFDLAQNVLTFFFTWKGQSRGLFKLSLPRHTSNDGVDTLIQFRLWYCLNRDFCLDEVIPGRAGTGGGSLAYGINHPHDRAWSEFYKSFIRESKGSRADDSGSLSGSEA